jgi:cytochrome o ubiquinol oxidase subunit IV
MNVIQIVDSGASRGRGSLQSYGVGLILALLLTAASFWIVVSGIASSSTVVAGVVALGLVQIVVHLVFFLHMNGSSAQRWHLITFMFAALVIVILVGGSLWIMYHLNHNMMPMPMG